MNFDTEKIEGSDCPRQEIVEYIDGELSSREEFDFELHLAGCQICVEELNAQKKVSTSLEIMLEDESSQIQLPENFTKIVTAKAESNLSGLRSPKERSRGLFICAILFLLIIFSFGINGETVLFAYEKFTVQFLAVGGFVLHLFYQLALGISATFGSLCVKFIFSSTLTLLSIITTFVIASMILSRMIFRFNRN
jgi:hypothetical protein